jgi:hypothetical protein
MMSFFLPWLVLFTSWRTSASTARSADIASVAWIAGCWELKDGRRTVNERWMPPLGNTMLGAGRTVRGDSLTDYEIVIIRAGASGLAYEAHPSGQPAEVFTAAAATATRVVFENVKHDFPRQVGYERRGSDSLVAWIAGPLNGSERRIEFPYARVRCDAGAP